VLPLPSGRPLDGFNISPYLVPDGLDDIVEQLVPELQARGRCRTCLRGHDAAEHLDLPPVHRRANASRASGADASRPEDLDAHDGQAVQPR